jgi:RNA polymerase primary sigma factor
MDSDEGLKGAIEAIKERADVTGAVAQGDLLAVLDSVELPAKQFSLLMDSLAAAGLQVIETDEPDSRDAIRQTAASSFGGDHFGAFLNKARHRILTAEEEYDLGVTIDNGQLAEQALSAGVDNAARLDLERQIEDGRRAIQTLVLHNVRLVVSIAKHYVPESLALEDLVQEGYFGLLRAAEKFDPYRKVKFSTYATWWVRQSIRRAIDNTDRLIRLPVHVQEELAQMRKAESRLRARLGREPTRRAVAKEMGLPIERVDDLRSWASGNTSLDSVIGDDGQTTLADFITDGDRNPALLRMTRTSLNHLINELLDELGPREREVMELRYGLKDGQPRTLEEVGKVFNVTRERIRQIETRTLARLRHPTKIRQLEDLIGD